MQIVSPKLFAPNKVRNKLKKIPIPELKLTFTLRAINHNKIMNGKENNVVNKRKYTIYRLYELTIKNQSGTALIPVLTTTENQEINIMFNNHILRRGNSSKRLKCPICS